VVPVGFDAVEHGVVAPRDLALERLREDLRIDVFELAS
jgi:hypothetical protein